MDEHSSRRELQGVAALLAAVKAELDETTSRIDPAQAAALAEAIVAARRVYVTGVGRSGLVSACFAMRLVHLGLIAHVVGEATAPGIGEGDLLVVASGSGQTKTVLAQIEAARTRGATVAAVVGNAGSPVAVQADLALTIACPPYTPAGPVGDSVQPGGSLFEQALLLVFDALVLDLSERIGWSPNMLALRHSNLE